MSLFVMSPCYCPTDEPAQPMMRTARRVGLEPFLYGVGQQITTNCSNAQGTGMLALMEQRSEDYILCVDCMDVAFLAGAEEIMSAFMKLNTGLLVSAESDGITGVLRTRIRLAEMCTADGGYHAHLNMGGWIGERKYALHVFKEAERLYRPIPEDSYNYDVLPQWLMQMKAQMGVMGEPGPEGPAFMLDWHCQVFQSMNRAPGLEWEGKRVHNTTTDTRPMVIHYNGDKTRGAYHEIVSFLLEN